MNEGICNKCGKPVISVGIMNDDQCRCPERRANGDWVEKKTITDLTFIYKNALEKRLNTKDGYEIWCAEAMEKEIKSGELPTIDLKEIIESMKKKIPENIPNELTEAAITLALQAIELRYYNRALDDLLHEVKYKIQEVKK